MLRRLPLTVAMCVMTAAFGVSPVIMSTGPACARTWLVRPDGTGDVPTIQAGVQAAEHGDTVLCAPGRYSWYNQGTGTDYGMVYILRGSADMTIKSSGGADVTILDGENMGRIIFFQGETELTIDGFTFINGNAPNLGSNTGGGFAAHLSSPVIKNSKFLNCSGQYGGAYWYGGWGAPEIIDCLFDGNNASGNGGAIYLINSPLTALISGCVIRDNTAAGTGGACYAYNMDVIVEDTEFYDNTAGTLGGAFRAADHSSIIRNCTFYGNLAADGGAIENTGTGVLTIERTIFMACSGPEVIHTGVSAVTMLECSNLFGNLAGDWVGGIAPQLGVNGNFSANPLFCDAAGHDFGLDFSSPCAPGNHPDGTSCGGWIGARGVSCGSVPTRETSWGALKSMFGN